MTRAADVLYREFQVENVRAVEGQDRTYRFIVATEAPVNVGIGRPEVLRMRGVDMTRMRPSCPLLDTHSTSGIKSIIGLARAEVVGNRMEAEITLGRTPEGDGAKARIDDGSLRTASIGYRVDMKQARELRAGQTDGEGESAVSGPALIQNAWAPYEITLCPVPADERAIRIRSINEYAGNGRKGGVGMSLEYGNLPVADAAAAPPAPAPVAPVAQINEERAQRARAAIDAQIRGLAPASCKDVADECVMDGLDLEASRAKIRAAYNARTRGAPNGTPEPAPAPAPAAPTNNPAPEITAETVLRAFTGLRS